MPAQPLTLLTFAPMIDSEAARMLLAHYRRPYVEKDRLFGWVSLLTLLHGGYGRIPLVSGDGKAMSSPREIAARFDALDPARRLVPTDPQGLAAAEAEWTRLNWTFGSDVAAIAYFHLLPERALMIESFGAPITATGRAALPIVYPLLAFMFRAALRLTEANAAAALDRVRGVLDATDTRIADGRTFLNGDTITLADIGIASSAAPLMLPSNYARQLPPYDAMPIVLRDIIAECRARPSAALVERVYAAIHAK